MKAHVSSILLGVQTWSDPSAFVRKGCVRHRCGHGHHEHHSHVRRELNRRGGSGFVQPSRSRPPLTASHQTLRGQD